MNPPWGILAKPKHQASAGQRPRKHPARFIPQLESLEDRCVPSVVPTIVFADGTVGQPAASQPSNITSNSQQPTSSFQANISVSVGYVGSDISFVAYASTSGVSLVPMGSPYSIAAQDHSQVNDQGTNVLILSPENSSNVVSQVFHFDLFLPANTVGGASTYTTYNVGLQTFDTAAGATLGFTLTAVDAWGKRTAPTSGLIQTDASNPIALVGNNTPGNQTETTTQVYDLSFSNPNGPSTFWITLSNLNFFTPGTWTASRYYEDNTGAVALVTDLVAGLVDNKVVLNAIGDGNDLSVFLHHFLESGDSIGQTRGPTLPDGKLIVGPHSLVLADTAPGFYLTLSITEEIGQRSSSAAAQATWTGLRPPLEVPLITPRSPNTNVGWVPANAESNSRPSAVRDLQIPSQTDIGPMEIMVANILRSLQQAKADDRAEDIAQAAVREPAEGEVESASAGPISNPAFAWEFRGEPESFGDTDVSLNQLLDGMALNDAISFPSREEFAEYQLNTNPKHMATTKPASSGWGWRMLTECMATVLLILCWPVAIWSGPNTHLVLNSWRRWRTED